jgi:hypothetical protein
MKIRYFGPVTRLTSLSEHTRFMNERHKRIDTIRLSSREPEVGIFWLYEGKIFYQESVPKSEAFAMTGKYLVGDASHLSAWRRMEQYGMLEPLPPHLRLGLDALPRGKVGYDTENDVYLIAHGRKFSEEERSAVINAFRLPRNKIAEEVDPQYDANPIYKPNKEDS